MELVTHFSVGSIKCFKDHLQNATAISFSCVEQQQNIYVGELYLKNSNHIWYNVAQILASQDIVAFNEQFFNTGKYILFYIEMENRMFRSGIV